MINRETVNLQALVNRYKMFKKYEKQPQNKQICEREIKDAERLILETVLKNDGNPALQNVFVKWEEKNIYKY